jgi:hypothetical protein
VAEEELPKPRGYPRGQTYTEVGLVVACVGVFVLLLFDAVLAYGLFSLLIGLALVGLGTRRALDWLAVARYRDREAARRRPTGGAPKVLSAPAERVGAVEGVPTYPWSFPWPGQGQQAIERGQDR